MNLRAKHAEYMTQGTWKYIIRELNKTFLMSVINLKISNKLLRKQINVYKTFQIKLNTTRLNSHFFFLIINKLKRTIILG